MIIFTFPGSINIVIKCPIVCGQSIIVLLQQAHCLQMKIYPRCYLDKWSAAPVVKYGNLFNMAPIWCPSGHSTSCPHHHYHHYHHHYHHSDHQCPANKTILGGLPSPSGSHEIWNISYDTAFISPRLSTAAQLSKISIYVSIVNFQQF